MKEYIGKTVKIMCCSTCNTKCKHCYISYKGDFNPEELYDVVNKLKDKYEVRLNGTEPLINKEYLKSFKLANEPFVLTNGLELYKNIDYADDIVKAGIKRVCLSYHYGVHDKISSVPMSIVESIVPKLRIKGLDAELMCTISSANYNKVLEFCEKALEIGANKVYFIEYMYTGNAKNSTDKMLLTEQQKNEFFKQLKLAREKYDIDTLQIDRCGNFGKSPYSNNKNYYCPAYIDLVVMTPDYKLYPCNFLIAPENEIGYYKEGKLYVIDNYERDCFKCLYAEKCGK